MAAIPDTGGARYAPCGVMRALSRVALIGGLAVAGWLLGAGIGHADEDLGQSDTSLVQLLQSAPSEGGSGGQLDVPPPVSSAVTSVLSIVSAPRLPVQPPVKPGVLKSLDQALAPVSRPLSGPTKYGAGIRSQAPAEEPATVPPAERAVRTAAATASGPTPGSAPRLTTGNHALPAAALTTDPFAGQLALGDHLTAPVPANPPASTTSPHMIGSAGGGAGTKSAPDVAVNDIGAAAGPAPMHRLRYLSASDLPRSPAAQPSTSPD